MSAGRIQLGGFVGVSQLDSNGLPLTGDEVDVSAEISSLIPTRSRNQVTRAATYGRPRQETRLGVEQPGSVAIAYEFDESDSGLFYQAAKDAFESDSGELYVRVRYREGLVGATNPETRFYMGITQFALGTTVMEWKQQNQTFVARDFSTVTA